MKPEHIKRWLILPFSLSAISLVTFCNTPLQTTARPHPTPTPQPTRHPRPTPTPRPTSTPSPSPVPSPSTTPTSQPTPTSGPTTTPTPTASPSPAPSSTNWSAPSNYPPYSWTPYAPSPNSVWNTPFQTNPSSPDPNGSTYTATYSKYNWFTQAITFGYASESNQYQHPIYFGYASDPVYKIKCTASWASQCPKTSFHIPSYAVPAGGSDAHLTAIDYTYSPAQELDCWSTNTPSGTGGTLTAQACGAGPLSGTGLTFGQTGAGYAQWAGIIRAQELIAGQINHALFMVTPCSSNSSVYPSQTRTSDAYCAGGAPYGARLRLNMTPAQINALSVPSYHKTILLAASTYGVYMGDNNNTGLNFQTEADEMYQSAGVPNPLVAWAVQNGVPYNGSSYQIDISGDVPTSSWQWLLPPSH